MIPAPAMSVVILIATFVAVILLDALHQRKHIKTATVIGVLAALLPLAFLPAAGEFTIFKADLFTMYSSVLLLR
jgi:hypothetical protein